MNRPVENTQDNAGCITPVLSLGFNINDEIEQSYDVSQCSIYTKNRLIHNLKINGIEWVGDDEFD